MQINISNKAAYTLLFLVLVVAGFVTVKAFVYTSIPNPGHGADQVWIAIAGQEMTLQDAISNGLVGGSGSSIEIQSTRNATLCSLTAGKTYQVTVYGTNDNGHDKEDSYTTWVRINGVRASVDINNHPDGTAGVSLPLVVVADASGCVKIEDQNNFRRDGMAVIG